MRITRKDLQNLADRINEVLETPAERFETDKPATRIGHHYIGYAYGGVALLQIVTASGGVNDIFGCGYIKSATFTTACRRFYVA